MYLASYYGLSPFFFRLKDVPKEKVIAPDNRSLEDRIGTLVRKTAEDIKDCSNACDTFSKKRLIAKVLQGPMWDLKLLDYVAKFGKRRNEFEFELTLHMSQSMDAAVVKLDIVDGTTKNINAKSVACLLCYRCKFLKSIIAFQNGCYDVSLPVPRQQCSENCLGHGPGKRRYQSGL